MLAPGPDFQTTQEQVDKECEESQEYNERRTIFTCFEALENSINKIGTQTDFFKLRQLNQNCYEILNRTYFNFVEGCILLIPKKDPKDFYGILESHPSISTETKAIEWKFRSGRKAKNDSTNSFVIPRMDIPPEKLTSYKHIFRKFVLDCSKLDLKLIKICTTELSSFITEIGLDNRQFPSNLENWTMSKFLNEFTVLKDVHVSILKSKSLMMSLEELENQLDNLKLKPHITFHVLSQHEQVLAKFGTKANMTFKLEIMESSNSLEEFEHLSTKFRQLNNMKFTRIHLDLIQNLDQLKTLTSLWLIHGKHMAHLDLSISIDEPPAPFHLQHQEDIDKCVIALSPFITKLDLFQSPDTPEIVSSTSFELSKLIILDLTLCDYKYPLEILKYCPKLRILQLFGVDQDACFFSNKERSNQQNLQYYFSNLNNLESIEMICENDNIIKDNNLDSYLKGLLPSIKNYIIYTLL